MKVRRKLRNPINAVKGKIDGETTEFRGAVQSIRIAGGSRGRRIDRRDANLSNCTLGTGGCITIDLSVARVRTISAFQSVCSSMLLCPSRDKSICGPFTIVALCCSHTCCDRRLEYQRRPREESKRRSSSLVASIVVPLTVRFSVPYG